jgi:hypothetical protein
LKHFGVLDTRPDQCCGGPKTENLQVQNVEIHFELRMSPTSPSVSPGSIKYKPPQSKRNGKVKTDSLFAPPRTVVSKVNHTATQQDVHNPEDNPLNLERPFNLCLKVFSLLEFFCLGTSP